MPIRIGSLIRMGGRQEELMRVIRTKIKRRLWRKGIALPRLAAWASTQAWMLFGRGSRVRQVAGRHRREALIFGQALATCFPLVGASGRVKKEGLTLSITILALTCP